MKSKSITKVECRHRRNYTNLDRGSKCTHRYELIYFVSGSGGLKIEGTFLPFEKETIYLLKPLTYYEICMGEGTLFDRYHISFSSANITEDLAEFVKTVFDQNNSCAIIKDFSVNELRRIFSGITFAKNLAEKEREAYITATLQQILILISTAHNKRSVTHSDEFASQVADFISKSLENNKFLTLDEIAKTFFVSKFYLCRVFKSYSGTSIHAYINQKRIMKAKQYIDSGMGAKEVSEAVGYQDYSAFYRAYVKVMGISPKSKKGE